MVNSEQARRTFQIVVAATKQWGIGKGKWQGLAKAPTHISKTKTRTVRSIALKPSKGTHQLPVNPATHLFYGSVSSPNTCMPSSPSLPTLLVHSSPAALPCAGGTLPWHLPGDMKYFKELTSRTEDVEKQNAVIMGRRTWDSIPEKFRPLPGRVNIVLSRSTGDENTSALGNGTAAGAAAAPAAGRPGSVIFSRSLTSAMELLSGPEYVGRVESVFVIGGGQIYKEALESPLLSAVHLTVVEGEVECDTHMPPLDEGKFRCGGGVCVAAATGHCCEELKGTGAWSRSFFSCRGRKLGGWAVRMRCMDTGLPCM
jgi:dihydrofolate reductase